MNQPAREETPMSNADAIGAFIASAAERPIPPEVLDAARLCLADWMSVAIGAREEPAGRIARETVAGWRSHGRANVLFGGTAAAPFAALANGTLAHCLDFDDTYVDAVTHTSAPVWAATLALGQEIGAAEPAMLAAFVTGFEVAARVGHGLGQAATARGWHGTGLFGRIGAAAASAALLRLDADRARHAVALAATQTSGLTASFGTMAKPFHAGKAGMDGVLSAQLAAGGFTGAPGLLEPGGGLDNAVIQDGSLSIAPVIFGDVLSGGWRILRNSFKPYAACHLIHPAIDASRLLLERRIDPRSIQSLQADVGALAMKVTGGADGDPATPLAGKFDLRHCVALALHGRDVSAADFREPWTPQPAITATAAKIAVSVHPDMGFASAALTAVTPDGPVRVFVPVAKGHPGNPMGWTDMERKFGGLTAPELPGGGGALFDPLRRFGAPGTLAAIQAIVAALPAA
jgi:2-methylcitrate dehydratase PrpD